MQTKILRAIRKTQNTVQKKSYLLQLDQIVKDIETELKNQTYHPKRFYCFAVQDPKIREIFAPHYRDRIVHHLLIEVLENKLDPQFIYDSYANRKTKGCHVAVSRLRSFIRKQENQYFLQLDVKSFFTSINKNILLEILADKIKDFPKTKQQKFYLQKLNKKIILHNPTKPLPIFTGNSSLLSLVPPHKSMFHSPSNTALPIGSLTSQFFANLYLNELDQFIKHQLKTKYYIRYVDDFVLLSSSKKQLKHWKKEIEQFLKTNLKLCIHPKKIKLQHRSKGIDFLGYFVKSDYILVRKRVVKNLKRRLYFFNHLLNQVDFPISDPPPILKLSQKYRNKELIPPIEPDLKTLYAMMAVINSYYGIFRFANSFGLRSKIYHKHFHLLKNHFKPKNGSLESFVLRQKRR